MSEVEKEDGETDNYKKSFTFNYDDNNILKYNQYSLGITKTLNYDYFEFGLEYFALVGLLGQGPNLYPSSGVYIGDLYTSDYYMSVRLDEDDLIYSESTSNGSYDYRYTNKGGDSSAKLPTLSPVAKKFQTKKTWSSHRAIISFF